MRAAVAALRQLGPTRIVVAVPIATPDTCNEISAEVDEMICAETPGALFAISQWYEKFGQTTDDEVRDLLGRGAWSPENWMKFSPPTIGARRAIGPLERLPGNVRNAFLPHRDFEPTPTPDPSDWLFVHAEHGQTFEDFVRSQP
jgi:hypothetical protein